ncbi:MAG: hypothetical protein IT381_32385 [Deltaproteobacteria bacterium]|nr:hypothetical protein [Deltaproteobacteria bacterium]
MNELEKFVEIILIEMSQYYCGTSSKPRDFREPGRGNAAGWTSAEIDFFRTRLRKAGYRVSAEHEAGLRLPPDLVACNPTDDTLQLHLERETRGWEWNHVFGALLKLLFVNDTPAPITVMILDSFGSTNDPESRFDLLRRTAQKLLDATEAVQTLFIATWSCTQGGEATVLRFVRAGRGRRFKAIQVYPTNKTLRSR